MTKALGDRVAQGQRALGAPGGGGGVILSPFGGPGGWDVGAASLGLRPIGVEWEAAECATRAAAGLLTIRADVAAFPLDHLAGRVEGVILSPPCQDFSVAGKRAGLAGVRGQLVYEVLRWVLALRPRWVACEQVPSVLPIWRLFRDRLRAEGYSAWCGVLDAADYGVPQNRKRAFLLASLDRQAAPPPPTHSRHGSEGGLFGGGGLERWVSMAEALGWGYAERPARTMCGNRSPRWLYEAHDVQPYERDGDRPAPTVDTKAGRGQWVLRHPGRSYTAEPLRKPAEGPAPAVALGHNLAEWCWERPATTVLGTPRIAPPGHHEAQFDDAVPVELWELGVLQGFPADYPWQGNKTERARQIGNAIPPPLASAVLGAVTGRA